MEHLALYLIKLLEIYIMGCPGRLQLRLVDAVNVKKKTCFNCLIANGMSWKGQETSHLYFLLGF